VKGGLRWKRILGVEDNEVHGRGPSVLSGGQLELNFLTFEKAGKARRFNSGHMDENILVAFFRFDKPEPLREVKPLNRSGWHLTSFQDFVERSSIHLQLINIGRGMPRAKLNVTGKKMWSRSKGPVDGKVQHVPDFLDFRND
jgi:hypothetical protein